MPVNYATFRKPSRYIGNEINMIRKEGSIRTALCFPDTYEIGMSHMGLKILYSIINKIPDVSAERVFAPWVDLESHLREKRLFLTSLEHQRPLKEFDIIGFTLQYELSYTNLLNMLDLGGVPVRSEDRGDDSPIVIAGGPCAVNPLPLVPFIDAFVIGDGEEVIKEIIEVYADVRSHGSGAGGREKILTALSQIESVYVPSVHDSSGKKIGRRIIEDLDDAFFPVSPVLPFTPAVHDRVAIEISRGCTRGCRFCQAGMIYRPLRERSAEKVISLSKDALSNTGYEEVSFTSLSAGDYSELVPLVRNFNKLCDGSHISVSLPSLRVGSIGKDLVKEIKAVRKSGFTIAPEAGTKRLRDFINKDFTDEEFDETLNRIFSEGWKNIKLYFMIGLPSETDEDIEGIIGMVKKAARIGKKITGKRVNINVGVSAFVPKTFTPFQWTGQDSMKILRNKQDYLKKAFGRGINFKGQHVENSLLEAVFSRGDRDSSGLLEAAWKLGCRFDGWSEHFDFEKWLSAAEMTGIDLEEYASRRYELDDELPWDFIDTGIKKSFLGAEYEKALKGVITSDCRYDCTGCGLVCKHRKPDMEQSTKGVSPERKETGALFNKIKVPGRMRVRFSKTGEMRYLSNQELLTSILRALARAKIPISYSEGFNPHPRISFGPALPAGVAGLNEFFDIETYAIVEVDELKQRLNAELPEGIDVADVIMIDRHEKSLNNIFSCYEYEVKIDRGAKGHIEEFIRKESWPVAREKKTVDIRPMVEKAEIIGDKLHLVLRDSSEARCRLFEVVGEMLNIERDDVYALDIKRTALYGYNKPGQNGEKPENRKMINTI